MPRLLRVAVATRVDRICPQQLPMLAPTQALGMPRLRVADGKHEARGEVEGLAHGPGGGRLEVRGLEGALRLFEAALFAEGATDQPSGGGYQRQPLQCRRALEAILCQREFIGVGPRRRQRARSTRRRAGA